MYIIVSLVLNALALLVTAYLVPGFHIHSFLPALFAAFILGILNTIVRPILLLLTLPLNILTLGLFTFVVNAMTLWLATLFAPDFKIDGFLSALLAAVVLSVFSLIIAAIKHDIFFKRQQNGGSLKD